MFFSQWFSRGSDWNIFRRSNLRAESDHSHGDRVTDEYERTLRTCKIEYRIATWDFSENTYGIFLVVALLSVVLTQSPLTFFAELCRRNAAVKVRS